MSVTLSVSIVTYAVPQHPSFDQVLSHLFEAISNALASNLISSAAITIIDNGSNETIRHGMAAAPAGTTLRVIKNERNTGYSAHNKALTQPASDIHLILNPDVLLDGMALAAGIQHLNSSPDTVMACPYSENDDGSPSYLCKRYPAVFDLLVRGFAPDAIRKRLNKRLSHYEYRELPVDQPTKAVELVSGCCMLARTPALNICGGFDPRFFLYFEDFDLSLRMRKLGQLDYCPAMQIKHYGGNAARKGLIHIYYFISSAAKFYALHGLKLF